jgi:hypothetical protein
METYHTEFYLRFLELQKPNYGFFLLLTNVKKWSKPRIWIILIGGTHLAATLRLSFLLELVAECHDSWHHDTVSALPVATQATMPHSISTELLLSLSLSFFCTLAQAATRSAPCRVESTPRRWPLAPAYCCSLLHTPSPIQHFLSTNVVHLFHSLARSLPLSAPASARSASHYCHHRHDALLRPCVSERLLLDRRVQPSSVATIRCCLHIHELHRDAAVLTDLTTISLHRSSHLPPWAPLRWVTSSWSTFFQWEPPRPDSPDGCTVLPSRPSATFLPPSRRLIGESTTPPPPDSSERASPVSIGAAQPANLGRPVSARCE